MRVASGRMTDVDPASLTPAESVGSPDEAPPPPRAARRPGAKTGMAALTVGALGVVFGDIGTSPLYALQTVFSADHHAVRATQAGVYGVISLVFWTITIIVSVKYVTFIMRADNEGEGGIMALIALIQRGVRLQRRSAKAALVALGIFGASLFYGDGMITPAISVLSAVEGLEVAAPSLEHLVVPITLVILTVLFAVQRYGTGAVGRAFGPVMGIWFALLALSGLGKVVAHPGILRAISPSYGLSFLFEHGHVAFIALGSVVLTVTGAEALYADMGHFGRAPIRRAWFAVVFPALTLNYLAQAALILHPPDSRSNPFFLLLPGWARLPMVILATAATVIASQAVISGAFSVSREAMRLGLLPPVTVRQTSEHAGGQIYLPGVNAVLFVGVLAVTLTFRSSARLATAYGVSVTGALLVDTILLLLVGRVLWHWQWWKVALAAVGFGGVEATFLAANLYTVAHGGFLPLLVAAGVFTVMATWRRGRAIVSGNRRQKEGSLQGFVEETRQRGVPRVPGTAVFPHPGKDTTPLA